MIIKTEGDLCNWIWMDEMLHSETAFFLRFWSCLNLMVWVLIFLRAHFAFYKEMYIFFTRGSLSPSSLK